MKFCPECGEDLRGSTKFCPECGFNMASLMAPALFNYGDLIRVGGIGFSQIHDLEQYQEWK